MWRGRTGEFCVVPTSTAPLPELNNTCPECGQTIADGVAWQLDPEAPVSVRLHGGCLVKRQERRAAERAASAPQGDGYVPGAGYAPEDESGPAPEPDDTPINIEAQDHERDREFNPEDRDAAAEAVRNWLDTTHGAEAQRQQRIDGTLLAARALSEGATRAAGSGDIAAALTLITAALAEVVNHLEALR
jgi:hypothetical protein